MLGASRRALWFFCILIPILTFSCRGATVANVNISLINKSKTITETSSSSTNVKPSGTTFSTPSPPSEQLNQGLSTNAYDTMKKMNLIKANSPSSPTPNPETIVNTYRVNNSDDGTTCILMTVDALLSFIYPTKLKQVEESDAFVPAPGENNVVLTGDCSSGERSSMLLKWKSFVLNFDFAKTPGGERWFVNGIQLSFNTKESTFKHPVHDNTYIQAGTIEGDILFPTPVGRSFKCHREIEVGLYDPDHLDLKVKLLFRKLTLEPFIFKNDDFGPVRGDGGEGRLRNADKSKYFVGAARVGPPLLYKLPIEGKIDIFRGKRRLFLEYLCAASGSGSFRSETAPFIFGSLLIIASLGTIGGYAAYRYTKVNKVQYDAME